MSRQATMCQDLREYPHKDLSSGTWVSFWDVDPDVTDVEIQEMIANRTGVVISLENIQLKAFSPEKSGVIVSIQKHEIVALLSWALADDELRGRKISVHAMKSAKW